MAGDAGVVLLFVWHASLSTPVLKTCIRLCTIFLYECCGFFCAVWTRMFRLSGLWCHNVKGIEGRVLAMKYIVVRKIYPGIVKVRTGFKRLSWNVSTCIWMYFKHIQAFYSCGVSATNRSKEEEPIKIKKKWDVHGDTVCFNTVPGSWFYCDKMWYRHGASDSINSAQKRLQCWLTPELG